MVDDTTLLSGGQVAFGEMADFGLFNSIGNSPYGNGRHRYKLRLVKWLTLENEKKTAFFSGIAA